MTHRAPGVENGRLAPPPRSPNCVSSQTDRTSHRVPPLPLLGDPAQAIPRLRALIEAMPRTRIVTESEGYLHAEFRTRWLGFVDDLELLVDAPGGVIHVRSASRVGYSDLGANRNRVEALRTAWGAANAGG